MTTLESPGLSSQSVSGFSNRKGPKTLKRTGMQPWEAQAFHWGFLAEKGQQKLETDWVDNPGRRLSSQSVPGFPGRKGANNPETDWDDNPGKPRLVIPDRFGVSGRTGPKNPETNWDDNPGKPRLVIPIRFCVFWREKAQKTPKRTGMTTLGSPGFSSQCVFGFLAEKEQITPKQTGMTTMGSPGLSSQSVSGFSGRTGPKNFETDLG